MDAHGARTGRLLVAGTTSDAGKTLVTTGLCRAFARRGLKVAPFKAQNMSNNSMVCADGAELGRAQWVQALAAGVEPEAAMNPVLLKPGGDERSHVVVMGKPAGDITSAEFPGGRAHLARAAYAAYRDLLHRFDLVVCEGAGSPAEINLRAGDYVNMGLARHGDVPTVLVGDIDRGGVFAAFYGTVALLEPEDQALVAGFVVNKFRGDDTLLAPGLRRLEELTGRRVYGTLPWTPDVWLDSEDTLDTLPLRDRPRAGGAALRVVVVRLPRVSNATDVDALGLEPGVEVVFTADPHDLDDADLVVLPGTRATVADLAWLRSRGLDRALVRHAEAGRAVLGICGGFQMLGRHIHDPQGVETADPVSVPGLGLLPVETTFSPEKTLRLSHGTALGAEVSGYEIHHGRITRDSSAEEFLGGARVGRVLGTMWHGSLESDALRTALLNLAAGARGRSFPASEASFGRSREARLDLLGDLVERHLDVDALLDLARHGPPPVPTIGPHG
ncbi:cobyric acid synthase [Saccharomonospora cyanea]|uniref:Cobyric acid synthase n=1 Tax=Saccharomonospora cyanea NA-134 TaxID=882082 RepID=H5XNK8_9PSEU|nr:cobyric acid synthase [Saccharomonospora cyanea]EHR61069.1 cobyric acid synthase CobQ [Saccharomonospora cyanea NA-134]